MADLNGQIGLYRQRVYKPIFCQHNLKVEKIINVAHHALLGLIFTSI